MSSKDPREHDPSGLADSARRWWHDTIKGPISDLLGKAKGADASSAAASRPGSPSKGREAPPTSDRSTRNPGGEQPVRYVARNEEEASAQRLNAIVDFLENQREGATRGDRATMYRIVTLERDYQQQRYRQAREELAALKASKGSPKECARLEAVMAEAEERNAQMYGLLKSLTGKLHVSGAGGEITDVPRRPAVAGKGLEAIQLGPDREQEPLWTVGWDSLRQPSYPRLGAAKVTDESGREYGAPRLGDYVEVTSATADLSLQVRLARAPGRDSVTCLRAFALRLGPSVLVGEGNGGTLLLNGSPLTLGEQAELALPGASTLTRSGPAFIVRSEKGDTFWIEAPDSRDPGWRIRGEFPERWQGELRGAAVLDASSASEPGYWIGRQGNEPARLNARLTVVQACLDSWRVQPRESLLPARGS